MNRNCFTQFVYKSWRYPKVAYENIKYFLRGFKYAYQRITKGWCDSDTWNLDSYIEAVLIDTLRHLAKIANGYPGTAEFPTFESWQEWLYETADMIEEGYLFEDRNIDWANGNYEEYDARYKEATAKMMEGLQRVVDHIADLWD